MSSLVDQDHIGWKSWKLMHGKAVTYLQGNMGNFFGRLEVGWEKVSCWSTKVAICLKRIKIEEKLLWRAYRNHQRSFERFVLDPYGLLFPKIRGLQPPPKTSVAIISGKSKATDIKFGQYIHRVHANKSLLKILEKGERGRIQGCPIFLQYPLLSHKRVKLRTSNFVCTFIRSIGTKTL